ncbi:LLM class flavin-dependent oxidoreductase [Enterovirga rhinocerotis]|uniref:FMN-dependent oxidoreductase (Nitrilotriacetate monooxygenase family) n=1 Tax=Enterovirga rhinocerotis TaxID=1339210 RepID=A0A4R7BXH7_9HYPH|nr:LLM class flavin-dependent oxidoreductase [Enterovirga rhinocerotis]TDR90213.1 FMN-dependent oxidoreductase (nitrilotriacetate monooxygenase family) [Enterovirga rhinocerotis]
MPRQMKLIAFMQAQNCSNYPASWRYPSSGTDWHDSRYYQRIGRILEDGKFHLAFFDDRLAIPDRFGDDFALTIEHGIRAAKLDPMLTALTMGLATERLGIGCTYSTTYYEPFHVARSFATMDLLLGGRAAWNVVTSVNNSEAANFGRSEHLAHDLRYDRADEFMEVVHGHWDSWEDDAIRNDKAEGLFADPAKVHRLDHDGRFFKSRGPFTVPRSNQGHPVIIQAGQSGRGKTFASRWGELIFVIYPNLAVGQASYREMKDHLAKTGRETTAIAPAVYPIVGETQAMAEDKRALIESLAKPADAMALLSEVLNYDLSAKDPDEAFSAEELEAISGMQNIRDRAVKMSGKPNPTVAELVRASGRGTIRELPVFVGTATSVADQMEEWFTTACDGFVVSATHSPGAYEDFVRLVVPELQRRGIFQRDYAGSTLRENLGLARPERGSWRRAG